MRSLAESAGSSPKRCSSRKVRANRKNAGRSTGPRTPNGRARASLNSLRHGILSERALLPGEDADALIELKTRLHAEFAPQGVMEEFLVHRLESSIWRIRRVRRAEAEMFSWHRNCSVENNAQEEIRSLDGSRRPLLSALGGEKAVSDSRVHREASRREEEARTVRLSGEYAIGMAFIREASGDNAFLKLARYETALERSLYRALLELQRLQAVRAIEMPQSPGTVDPNSAVSCLGTDSGCSPQDRG